jgi:hypothetical protein
MKNLFIYFSFFACFFANAQQAAPQAAPSYNWKNCIVKQSEIISLLVVCIDGILPHLQTLKLQ